MYKEKGIFSIFVAILSVVRKNARQVSASKNKESMKIAWWAEEEEIGVSTR
jgi:hypothetical protein